MSLRLLSTYEKSQLLSTLVELYNFDSDILNDYELLEGEEGYWAVYPQVISLPLRKLKIESIGLLILRGKGSDLIPTIAALQLFTRPRAGIISLSRDDASIFIDRKTVEVELRDGLYAVFFGDHAVDLGRVKNGGLVRLETKKPTKKKSQRHRPYPSRMSSLPHGQTRCRIHRIRVHSTLHGPELGRSQECRYHCNLQPT